jgi:spoIIIJ-associated protein
MNQEKTTLEVIAASVEEAVAKGLDQLGLSQDDVEVEVLDEGSRGIFGLGNRQARVRLTLNVEGQPTVPTETVSGEEKEEEFEEQYEEIEETKASTPASQITVEIDTAMDVAQNVVEELIEKMGIRAKVSTQYVEFEDPEYSPLIQVDINGNDLSILIGRRSETLNALQYVSSLIVAKELGRWMPIVVDVQGYRARRERQLRQLARRMADQAVKTGRRQVLEPMPANERRFVHLELRNYSEVTTESIGEEPNRKVTIIPKN